MSTIKKTYHIKAPINKVWQTLVDPKEIAGWGAGPAKMSAKPGSKFSIWGGDIFGKNIEVKAPIKLVQEWYGSKDWQKPSIAFFKLASKGDKTELRLEHSEVPSGEVQDFDAGWDNYYFGAIKEYLENG